MSDKLSALVLGETSPIVGPNTAAELRAFAALPEPAAIEQDQLDTMIGKLAMATAQAKLSPAEAKERLELYWLGLRDLPADDLRAAFVVLIQTAKFLPTPAEIRAAALKAGSARKFAKSRAKFLAWKHDVEWRPPVDPVPAQELCEMLSSIRIGSDDQEEAA